MAARQLSLFDDGRSSDDRSDAGRAAVELAVGSAAIDEPLRALGLSLDPRIRLGTSSWSFPGWTGLVYAARDGRPPGEQRLARAGLSAYAAHPLLRTVSLDRTFYAPLVAADFARYAAQVPDGFRFVVKAPAAFTDPVVRRPGSGEAVRDNPTFLDAAAAIATFVRPAVEGLGAKCGPLVFQFPPLGRRLLADLPLLERRITSFMDALSRGGPAPAVCRAVEVRDPQLVSGRFAQALADVAAMPGRACADAAGGRAGSRPRARAVRWPVAAGRPLEPPCRPRLRGGAGRLFSIQSARGGGSAVAREPGASGPRGGRRRPRCLHHDQQQGRGVRAAVGAPVGGADRRRRLRMTDGGAWCRPRVRQRPVFAA
jgi:uncharacterized protein YecE (DUF72 family)